MALTSDEPGDLLESFAKDEGGSAAVEFLVLVPVYLLLMVGLFMFTNLSLIRQSLVQASRFQAWAPQEPNTYANFAEGAFFGPYEGTYGGTTRVKTAVTHSEGAVQDTDLEFPTGVTGTAQAKGIAAHVLNNGSENTLYRMEAESEYNYSGLMLFGMTTDIRQSTRSVVLLTRRVERAEFQDGDQAHPMTEWQTGGGVSKTRYFDPSQEQNMPLSPLFNGGNNEFTDEGGGANPGIWNRRARIGGSTETENSYYYPKPKG